LLSGAQVGPPDRRFGVVVTCGVRIHASMQSGAGEQSVNPACGVPERPGFPGVAGC
jgi:hypothetical protein